MSEIQHHKVPMGEWLNGGHTSLWEKSGLGNCEAYRAWCYTAVHGLLWEMDSHFDVYEMDGHAIWTYNGYIMRLLLEPLSKEDMDILKAIRAPFSLDVAFYSATSIQQLSDHWPEALEFANVLAMPYARICADWMQDFPRKDRYAFKASLKKQKPLTYRVVPQPTPSWFRIVTNRYEIINRNRCQNLAHVMGYLSFLDKCTNPSTYIEIFDESNVTVGAAVFLELSENWHYGYIFNANQSAVYGLMQFLQNNFAEAWKGHKITFGSYEFPMQGPWPNFVYKRKVCPLTLDTVDLHAGHSDSHFVGHWWDIDTQSVRYSEGF